MVLNHCLLGGLSFLFVSKITALINSAEAMKLFFYYYKKTLFLTTKQLIEIVRSSKCTSLVLHFIYGVVYREITFSVKQQDGILLLTNSAIMLTVEIMYPSVSLSIIPAVMNMVLYLIH